MSQQPAIVPPDASTAPQTSSAPSAGLHPAAGRLDPRAHPVLAAAGKLLEDTQMKVSSVASRLTTASARDTIEALITGERGPDVLADLARKGHPT